MLAAIRQAEDGQDSDWASDRDCEFSVASWLLATYPDFEIAVDQIQADEILEDRLAIDSTNPGTGEGYLYQLTGVVNGFTYH